MKQRQIQLYYKNTTSEIIGSENGITREQLERLAGEVRPIIKKMNNQRLKGQTAYRDLPYNEKTAGKVKELSEKIKRGCENLVVLGIGGSALGNIALQTALNPFMYNIDAGQRQGPRLFVFDNVDPGQLASFLDWIGERVDKTIFNVISKSGRTAETASHFLIVRKMLLEKIGKEGLKKKVVATTDPKEGALRKIADETGMETLEVPDGVGGRFSVLSAVGLFSAAVCGIDTSELLAGARDMDKRVSDEDFYKNPAAVNAALNYYFYNRGKRISVMMPYSWALKDLADWYRQIWAESLGKAKDLTGAVVHIGPTPVKALGATDQHSQVQLYREGPNDKIFTFLSVENFGRDVKIPEAREDADELGYLSGKDLGTLLNCEKKGTEYALLKDGRPCMTISFPEVTPYTVGQFIYLYEVTTSMAGALFNINAYDQPAVELGKEATFALMGKKGNYKQNLTYEEFAEEIKRLTEVDAKYIV
jgi:glucose-6-phosphate isomerase